MASKRICLQARCNSKTAESPLSCAVQFYNHDVIELLIQHGADLELTNEDGETALFTAVRMRNTAAARQLLERGANVNHRQINGRTALFEALRSGHQDMVELLLAYGADVDVLAHCQALADKASIFEYGSTPLDALLKSYLMFAASKSSRVNHFKNATSAEYCMVEYFEIVKMLVTRGARLTLVTPHLVRSDPDTLTSGGHTIVSCLNICFAVEVTMSDLRISKYLLRNGATSDFIDLYRIITDTTDCLDCISTNFLKLVLLAGCKFDKYFTKLEEETRAPPVYAERVQPLHDSIKDLFSQPLTLQELSVMSIRQCIGNRQLWAKIDALPEGIPRSVKDIIKLKTV